MSRYQPPPPDSRFGPRERSRTPPPGRFGDRRPSGAFNSSFPGRPPPVGPRGRGAPPNPEYNELRNAPPLGTGRDRPFREREFDRRPLRAPSPPRPRSPPRPYRDGPPPRDLDTNRPRRNSRDGSFSAAPNFADPPPFSNTPFGRGGFGGRGRGRGRGDFDFRDRGRRPPFEDRQGFRPRERSPPPRWTRDPSRGEREDWRGERHDEDRGWSEREDREREYDRFRRDQPPTRFDQRNVSDTSSRPPTPHQQVPVMQPPPPERPPIEQPRDEPPPRRPSTTMFPPAVNPQRRDPAPQSEVMAGRAEATSSRYSKGSSPPPQAPQVPAFGAFSFKPAPNSGPLPPPPPQSNVWKAPPSPAPTPRAPSPDLKSAPTGPKAQTNAAPIPPVAPRALRGFDASASIMGFREPVPIAKPISQAAPSIPTAPAALRNDDRLPTPQMPQQRDFRAAPGQSNAPTPNAPHPSWGAAQSSARSVRAASVDTTSSRQFPFGDRKTSMPTGPRPDIGPSRTVTPPPSAPSGPRHSQSLNTSPNQIIPTAPKADRIPPTAPRAAVGRGQAPQGRPMDRPPPTAPRAPFGIGQPRPHAWNQWTREGVTPYRDAVIPAKRDLTGEEKSQRYKPDPSPKPAPASLNNDAHRAAVQASEPDVSAKTMDQANTLAEDSLAEEKREIDDVGDPVDPMVTDESSEDDGMDLDEEDFESTKAKFEQERSRLQAQFIDLSERSYRATTPLEQLARLAKVTAQDLPSEDDMTPEDDAPSLEDEQQSRSASKQPDEDMDQDLLTPKEEDGEDIIMDGTDSLDQIIPPPRPRRKQSPEVINLPYLLKTLPTSLSERDALQETLERQNACKAAVAAHLQSQGEEADEVEQDAVEEFSDLYRGFAAVTRDIDDERASKENLERQKSAEPGPEPDMAAAVLEIPNTESSRRLHKFGSEYDIQKAIRESEETARIEQERLERDAKRAKDDLEKEAPIPEMLSEEMRQRRIFVNTNQLRDAYMLTDIFGYDPPSDDFTEDEHRIFLEAFKERPKKWGEIAAMLPGRTYQHCIHHYYAFKWDGRFRETKNKRRAKVGRGRGGKAPARGKGAALMADLGRADEDAAPNATGVSESGRPKRAAARTTYTEKDAEGKVLSMSATPGRKSAPKLDANGEVTEKPVKRRKATAASGERAPKKSRAQPIAAAPVGSPLKVERDVQFRASELSREDQARVEEASLLAGLQTSYNRVQPDLGSMYPASEAFSQGATPGDSVDKIRPPGHGSLQRSSASSYWSVPEQQDFMKFITHFGTDFAAIATHMGTKTQTMVKNYYQRHAESGNRQELIDAANAANIRRDRGEDMGVPPAPTPIVKRRYDNPQPTAPRTLAPHAEPMEIEEVTSSHAPSGLPPQSRFPITGQPTPVPQRAAPTPLQAALDTIAPKTSSLPRSQPPGPRMGFFSESRTEQRPAIQPFAPSRPGPQPQSQPLQVKQQQNEIQARLQQEAQDPNSLWRRELIQEQERAKFLEREQQRLSSDKVPQLPAQHPIFGPLAPQGGPSHVQDRKPILDEQRSRTPSLSSVHSARPGQGVMRNMMGSPAPTSSAPPPLHPSMHPGTNPSPPKTVGFRPSSVPAIQANTLPVKAAPAEPRKTSNLASLLNSEPEEPRTSKRMSDQSMQSVINRTQSPAPLVRNPTPVGQSSALPMGRRETFGQVSAPRSLFDRPATTQPIPPTHVPTPPPKTEHPYHWANLQSARSREDWTPRGSIAQPQPPGSPRQAPLEREVRPYYSHRTSAFGPMNVPPRGNPSPPPHAHPLGLSHSRTPSFTQATPAPQQQQQQQGQGQGSHVLQPNPYAQPPGPAPHVQQMQAQQQNQMHHSHNTALASHPGMHGRQFSHDEEMANERYHRERMEMERAREQDARYQAQHQEQQRFSQHRPPPQPMHAPMHQGPQSAFPSDNRLSLREQSGLEANQSYREAQLRHEREQRDRQEQEMKEHAQWRRDEGEQEESRRQFEASLRATGAFVPKSSNGGWPPQRRRL